MSELTGFLLARIAEDYAAADLVLRPYGDHASTNDAAWWTSERDWFNMGLSSDETPLVMRMAPQRVLAECEAKRRIVETAVADLDDVETPSARASALADDVLVLLALPYAGHPDYRQEWKP